jgi:hypothetical protein
VKINRIDLNQSRGDWKMIRQIEIDDDEARRTGALMGLAGMLVLAICGIVVLRGLEQATRPASISDSYFVETLR